MEAKAAETRLQATVQAEGVTVVESAKVTAERDRMAIYRDLPPAAMMGLAARELAANLHSIEHLSLGPDMLGPLLGRLAHAGAARLESANEAAR